MAENTEEKINQKDHKKLKRSLVATGTAVSLLVGGVFNSPADLVKDMNDDRAAPPTAIVMTLDNSIDDDDDDSGAALNDEEKKKGGIKQSIRNMILRLPVAVRAALGIPLWAVGWAILSVLNVLWAKLLSPVAGTILNWVIAAGVILLAVLGFVKLVNPDIPMKKILNKRTVLSVLAAVVLLAGIDSSLPLIWVGYAKFSALVKFLGGAGAVGFVGLSVLKKNKKKENAKLLTA